MVDEDFVRLYERVDWFLRWLDESCDCGGFIINEWMRGDPPCFGTWAREKYREYQSSKANDLDLSEVSLDPHGSSDDEPYFKDVWGIPEDILRGSKPKAIKGGDV